MIIKKHPNLNYVYVSSCGKVFESLSRCMSISKHPVCVESNIHLDRYGYEIATLKVETCKANNLILRKKLKVHRLVAETFLDGDVTLFVDHIDRNTANNKASNLRYVTRQESNAENRKIANKHTSTEDRYLVLDLRAKGLSVKEIARLTNVRVNTVAEAVRPTSRIWKAERATTIL